MPEIQLEIPQYPELERDHKGIFPGMGILTELQKHFTGVVIAAKKIEFSKPMAFGETYTCEMIEIVEQVYDVCISKNSVVHCEVKGLEVALSNTMTEGHALEHFTKHPQLTVHGPSLAAISEEKLLYAGPSCFGYMNEKAMSPMILCDAMAQYVLIEANEKYGHKCCKESFMLTRFAELNIIKKPIYGYAYEVHAETRFKEYSGSLITSSKVFVHDKDHRICAQAKIVGAAPKKQPSS